MYGKRNNKKMIWISTSVEAIITMVSVSIVQPSLNQEFLYTYRGVSGFQKLGGASSNAVQRRRQRLQFCQKGGRGAITPPAPPPFTYAPDLVKL
jgi:hypothetical protein